MKEVHWGVWERTGNIVYKNSKPVDTVPISDEMFQTKIYTKTHALWLGNNKNIDSLGNDLTLVSLFKKVFRN